MFLPHRRFELADTFVGTMGVEVFLDEVVVEGKVLDGLSEQLGFVVVGDYVFLEVWGADQLEVDVLLGLGFVF